MQVSPQRKQFLLTVHAINATAHALTLLLLLVFLLKIITCANVFIIINNIQMLCNVLILRHVRIIKYFKLSTTMLLQLLLLLFLLKKLSNLVHLLLLCKDLKGKMIIISRNIVVIDEVTPSNEKLNTLVALSMLNNTEKNDTRMSTSITISCEMLE